MLDRAFLRPILDDESLTRGLGDEEARLLVDWLVERAENLAASSLAETTRKNCLSIVCRRGRIVGRFVRLWSEGQFGSAVQLAGAENVNWRLPSGPEEPAELMNRLLSFEEQRMAVAA